MQRGLPKDYPAKEEGIRLPTGATPPTPAATSDEVVPKPFFVVKTKNETKQKVFINVCGSHKVVTRARLLLLFLLMLKITILHDDYVGYAL